MDANNSFDFQNEVEIDKRASAAEFVTMNSEKLATNLI